MTKEALEASISRLDVWTIVFGVMVAVGVTGEAFVGWLHRQRSEALRVVQAGETAQQQERAANAERALVELHRRVQFRRSTFDMAVFKDILKDAPKASTLEIWYRPGDDEADFLASYIAGGLGSIGWPPTLQLPIPAGAVQETLVLLPQGGRDRMTPVQRVGAAPTGVTVMAKTADPAPPNAPTQAIGFLVKALNAAGAAPTMSTTDGRLAAGAIRIVVAQKP